MKMNLMEVMRPCHIEDKQPQPKRQKSINVIECHYKQKHFDEEDDLYVLDENDEEDLYE